MSVRVKVFGHGAMSDLSPFYTPKRTPLTITDLWVHAPVKSHFVARHRHSIRMGSSMPTARSRSAFRFAGEQDGDTGQHQHHADYRKGVAETHHQGLLFNGVAERDDRLLMCGGRIGHAMGQ